MRSRSMSVMVAAVACAVAMAQGQQPEYKVEVAAVPLDLVVIDQEGRPVAGLTPEDFQVTVDGRPRKVLTAQFLSSAAAGAPPVAATAKGAWDIDVAFGSVYASNERSAGTDAAPSRTVIIAIDQSGFATEAGRNAAAAARGLLDLLHPNDRVGLTVFPPPGPRVSPTRNHQLVRSALDRVTGAAEPFPTTDVALSVSDALAWAVASDPTTRGQILERACGLGPQSTTVAGLSSLDICRDALETGTQQVLQYAQRQTLVMLRGLTDVIQGAAASGSPSAIVVVSTGVYGAGQATQLGVDEEIQRLSRLAAASRSTLYALYVESGFLDRNSMERSGMVGFSAADGDMRLEGLRHLAGLSGGAATRVAAGAEAGFRRISLELSASYLLGVESLPADRDGRRHRLRVRVTRPGLTVRVREDLYLPAERSLSGDAAVRQALETPELQRALPIRLSTQMMREGATDKVRMVISALIGRNVKAGTSLRVGYVVRGAGAAATAGTSGVQVHKLPAVGQGEETALCFVETAQLTPGRYLLRLAAVDDENRVGSVEQVVDATLVGEGRAISSDLMLVDPPRQVEGTFTPVADGRITGDAVEGFVEIYPAKGVSVTAVAFEISDTPGGPTIAGGSIAPEQRSEERLTAAVNLDVRALPPGVYMLNARVLAGEEVVTRTSRPFLLERLGGAGTAGGPRAALAFAATGSLVRAFSREESLRPDALGYFLNRLAAFETAPAGEEIAQASAELRAARFEAALAALPGQSDQLSVAFLKGLALLGQGQLEPAAAQFRAALRISNDFLPAAFYLGACYAAGGRDREAVGAWQTSLVSETDSRIVYEVLADALLRLNDGGQAEAIIEEARQRWPGDEVFTPRLAAAKVLQNQRAEAFGVLEPYLERHPSESEPLFLAIRLLYEAHDSGKPLKGRTEDRALAKKYGERYQDAGGANQPLVARWVAAMIK